MSDTDEWPAILLTTATSTLASPSRATQEWRKSWNLSSVGSWARFRSAQACQVLRDGNAAVEVIRVGEFHSV